MRNYPMFRVLVMTVAMGLMTFSPARADDVYGRIRGTVADSSGAVMPGVPITATNVATGISRSIKATDEGNFDFVNLPAPAVYEVAASQPAFKRYVAAHINLALNQIYVLNIKMTIGQATQVVTVEAAKSQVESTSMEQGARISGQAIVDLPLNGRDWITLQRTLPGVVESAGDFTNNFSTSGSRAQDNEFLLNGVDNNDLELNIPNAIPSPDAIAEVNMITNTINPEYGRNGGAIMNAVTKSGTNRFHGDAFEFYRDPFLNARNFFLPESDQFHQNQFGGVLGGPIRRNHTFFFFSYQGTRNRQPDSPARFFAGGSVNVFTAAQRNGAFPGINVDVNPLTGVPTGSPFPLVGEDGVTHPAGTPYSTLFPTGQIPLADFSTPAKNLMNAYMPLPAPGTSTFSWNPISVNKNHQFITRVDHTFGSRDSLSGFWFIENDRGVDDESFVGGALPGFAEQQTQRYQNISLTWNHTFGSNKINEARVGYNRAGMDALNPVRPVLPSSFGFGINPQSGSAGSSLPCISMPNYQPPSAACEFGFSYQGPQPRIDQTYQLSDNFTWLVGKHTFKVGFDMRRAEVENPFYYINNGYFAFSGTGPFSTGNEGADFLLGIPDFYEQSSGGFIDARTQEYYTYFQDQWKFRPNLTLTYGLGWQVNTPQNDIYNGGVAVNAYRPGEQSTVYPTAPPGLLFPGDRGISTSTYGYSLRHFAPRVGFAWSPGGSQRWSVRGGFGIYYNQVEENVTLENLQATPFSLTDFGAGDVAANPDFANPFTGYSAQRDGTTGAITGVTTTMLANRFPYAPPPTGSAAVDFTSHFPLLLNVFNPKFTTPSAYNYNLTVQRELPSDTLLQIGYVGHQGRHLETRNSIDPAGQAPGVNPVCAADPNCGFSTLGFYEPQTLANSLTFQGFPVYGGVGEQATDANSNYNSLQVMVSKKTTHGLNFLAGYTWAHGLDPVSSLENVGGGGGLNPFNRHNNYGDSAYDARQRFVISYSYEIPSLQRFSSFQRIPGRVVEGWRIAGQTTLQTGFPISLVDSSDNSLVCWAYTVYGCPDRPNAVGTVQTYNARNQSLVNTTHGGNTAQGNYYFNPNAFTPETRGVLGNAGRNFFHGPGFNNFDLALFKDTKITESTKIELRLEVFNLFNHTQFLSYAVGNDINTSFFGQATAAADPRIIQLAAKFYF